MSNKGQVEVSFNWIYVMLAGTLILLFFVGLAVKQKTVSEENLGVEVVRVLGNILSGASAAEKTKNFIDISGLAEFTLYFTCLDEVGEYGIEGRSAKTEELITPIFSPGRIQSMKLITWSLPYNLPFKITDMLYVTAPNIKYYVWGNNEFVEEMEEEMISGSDSSSSFGNLEVLNDPVDYAAINPQKNYAVRIVDTMGTLIPAAGVPDELQNWDDAKVSAVVILDSTIDFYQKEGTSWRKLNEPSIPLISLNAGRSPDSLSRETKKRDAAKFAAVFSDTPENYICNMKKAWYRGIFVTQLYQAKAKELERYFSATEPSGSCSSDYSSTSSGSTNFPSALENLKNHFETCKVGECEAAQLSDNLDDLERMNNAARMECISLY
ncbi:hypothetical protein HYU21_02010 [Candidatus Woesearchaeota archaeon]|nr:hypothetical protein [Candidatus Woesearchaeota archaeon]